MKTSQIAFLMIASGFILSAAGSLAFAAGPSSPTLDRLRETGGSVNFDGSVRRSGTVADPPRQSANILEAARGASTSTVGGIPAVSTNTAPGGTVADEKKDPPKPTTLFDFMKEDLKGNKSSYLMAGVTGALGGYFLMGSVMAGALLGFGAIVLFLLVYRNMDKVKDK